MNIAFETALGYMGKVSSPRVITGNPHLLVERAERRFGFEYLSGLSGRPGLSNANKNAFTIDGKLYKLGVLDMVEGFSPT